MAFNLAKFAKLEVDPLRKGVFMNLLRQGPLFELIPFENVDSLTISVVQWTNLPTVGFRRINQGYTPSEGDYIQRQEAVYGLGGEIEFDRVFGKIKNTVIDPKVDQVLQKTTAMAYKFADHFINGDHASEVDGFEGIKKRISNANSRQTIDGSSDTSANDPTASAAKARLFLDKWREGVYKANGGDINAILCNEGLKWGFARVLEFLAIGGGPLFDTTTDMFDREVITYKGAPIIDVGLKSDQVTEIITSGEDPGDGGNDATSMYPVPFNTENGISGIQLSDPEVYDPLDGGERESKPTNLVRIDWWVGLAGFGSHGITRVNSIMDPAQWT